MWLCPVHLVSNSEDSASLCVRPLLARPLWLKDSMGSSQITTEGDPSQTTSQGKGADSPTAAKGAGEFTQSVEGVSFGTTSEQ